MFFKLLMTLPFFSLTIPHAWSDAAPAAVQSLKDIQKEWGSTQLNYNCCNFQKDGAQSCNVLQMDWDHSTETIGGALVNCSIRGKDTVVLVNRILIPFDTAEVSAKIKKSNPRNKYGATQNYYLFLDCAHAVAEINQWDEIASFKNNKEKFSQNIWTRFGKRHSLSNRKVEHTPQSGTMFTLWAN